MTFQHMQIGEVAQRTGLSLRTIRYYEEVGLIRPSARTKGGFRLYTEPDVSRLNLIKQMKPLGFSLEEMSDLLSVLDDLDNTAFDTETREGLIDRLAMYRTVVDERCADLRAQLGTAEAFSTDLRSAIERQRRMAARSQ